MSGSIAGLFLGLTVYEALPNLGEWVFWVPSLLGMALGTSVAFACSRPASGQLLESATASRIRFILSGASIGVVAGIAGLVVLVSLGVIPGIATVVIGLVACVFSGAAVAAGTLFTYGFPAR